MFPTSHAVKCRSETPIDKAVKLTYERVNLGDLREMAQLCSFARIQVDIEYL